MWVDDINLYNYADKIHVKKNASLVRYIDIINLPSSLQKVLNGTKIAFFDRKLPLAAHDYVSVDVIR